MTVVGAVKGVVIQQVGVLPEELTVYLGSCRLPAPTRSDVANGAGGRLRAWWTRERCRHRLALD